MRLFADVNFHFLELFTRKSYEYFCMFPNRFNVVTGTKGNDRLSNVVELNLLCFYAVCDG
jgi:hypothetical protein